MNRTRRWLYAILIITIIVFTNLASIHITKFFCSIKVDKDYEKFDLGIKDYNIEYCTTYEKNWLTEYKVYKIKDYYNEETEKMEKQLNDSKVWSKNKFYEYVMARFYEVVDEVRILMDREDLYYYHQKDIYAIFDLKEFKLFYLQDATLGNVINYTNILGITIDNYIDKEVYSVKSEIQGDGTDYYVFKFTEEKGNEVEKILIENSKWNKINDEIVESFEYNEEVKNIVNGYYYYVKTCRTSNKYKAQHFNDEEATGYELGIYDCDTNTLYYYWTSI